VPTFTPSRRNFLKAVAAASAGATVPLTAHADSCSPELLALRERLLVARTERDLLHLQLGRHNPPGITRANEVGVRSAHHESGLDRVLSELEAAEGVVCDIERAIIDFEPHSIADLRLQVELALHQERIDYGMDERLPRLICARFLRLIPLPSVSS
jgi:hypothetical protein